VKVLVLGSGAREHALVWRLSQGADVEVICAPGNPGIEALARCERLDPTDRVAVVRLVKHEGVGLVVVGPEAPLVAGVADACRAIGVDVFGPSAAAAAIEGSKAFAKEVMFAAMVPSARSETFTDPGLAARRALEWGPVVVKADGLAAGKGVVVAESGAEAAEACRALGATAAGARLVLEERLVGPELSVIALCDGKRYALLAPAQDHKRIFEGDRGPNTGGMGAYAPANLLGPAQLEAIGREVVAPVLNELGRRGTPFIGALYAGLMLTPEGPKVLEFNARLGDPETQPLLMQLGEPLAPLLHACARGELDRQALQQRPGASVAVVLASRGYPEKPAVGDVIGGLDAARPEGVEIFHAGTARRGRDLVTAGGRVLTVCAYAPSFEQARERAYQVVDQVTFEGRQVRRDIGAKAPR
jgi:phosphoribosylamine--glycine ligase